MEFTGNIVASNWEAVDGTPLLRDHGVVEIGVATLVFRGTISLTRNPAFVASGIPMYRPRRGLPFPAGRSFLDLTGTFCHNGDGTASLPEDAGIGLITAGLSPNDTGVILRDAMWRVPVGNAAFYSATAGLDLDLYAMQRIFIVPSTTVATGGVGMADVVNVNVTTNGIASADYAIVDMPTAC